MPKRAINIRFWRWSLLLAPLLLLAAVAWLARPLPAPLFPDDYSTLVLDRNDEILRAFLNGRQQWHLPPRPERPVPAKLQAAVLLYEDRRFFEHLGIDPGAVVRALRDNIRAGRVVSGASTLTMQVARLLKPKERSLANKLQEAALALHLEWHLSKEQILRLYLDHAPYGGNTVGFEAAAYRYYGQWPDALTWGQAATLAVLPNAPGLVSPAADPGRLKAKRDRLLERLRGAGHIDAATCELARREPVPAAVRPFPLLAPHLARRFKDAGRRVQTTVDAGLQRGSALRVARHVAFLRRIGVQNAAALVAETASGRVRAYVGSQGFFDGDGLGQVDGVQAPRSSGSLLKPLLYALAADAGLALPPTLLEDIPTQYGTFAPRNADERFVGLVAARQALVRSLNVPAVRLLQQYGLYAFYRFLQKAGVKTLFRRPDDYGLPLIIGGAEVTLWDMAGLYRGLARGGRFGGLQLSQEGEQESGPPLISPGACHLTLETLRQVHRPGAEFYWQQYRDQRPLAWKTGTSYGHRDAWAVGVSPRWTVAVWVGNFAGQGNANLAGASAAGPLLFDLFQYAEASGLGSGLDESDWFEAPPTALAPVRLCGDTGYAAGRHCPTPVQSPAPRHMPALPLCPYHRTLYLSVEPPLRQVCSLCWGRQGHRTEPRLVLPGSVAAHSAWVAPPPPHRTACPAQDEPRPLQIVYPPARARLTLTRDFDGRLQPLVLRAAHRDPTRVLHWYLDDRYLGRTRVHHTRSVAVDDGWHTLEVMDQQGQRARRRFFARASARLP